MARKPKRKTKNQWKEANDKLWSLIIRYYQEGAPRQCLVCGTTEKLQAHHPIHRTNFKYRWDLHNGVAVCISHHTYDGEISAHGRKGGRADAADRFIDTVLREKLPEHYAWYKEHRDDKEVIALDYDMLEEINRNLTEQWNSLNTKW